MAEAEILHTETDGERRTAEIEEEIRNLGIFDYPPEKVK